MIYFPYRGDIFIPRLFIENQPWELFRNDVTANAYEERCLGLSHPGDIIVTSNPIDASFISYLQDYGLVCQVELLTPKRSGRDLADAILLDKDLLNYLLKRVDCVDWSLETFLYGEDFLKLATILKLPINGSPELEAKYGTKSGFRRLAERVNIPIPPGLVLDQPLEKKEIRDFISYYGPAVIKEDDTLGGRGVEELHCTDEIMGNLRKDCLHLVEKKIESSFQGSVQVQSSEKGLDLLVVETHSRDYEFFGFEYPPSFSDNGTIKEQAGKIFKVLRHEGFFSGYAGIDFIIDLCGNVLFHDLNIRKTAVRYWLELAKQVLGNGWASYNVAAGLIPVKHDVTTFENVLGRAQSLLFKKARSSEGVILYNAALLPFKMIGVVAISKQGKSQQLLDEFCELVG
jgi:hypothetical protein